MWSYEGDLLRDLGKHSNILLEIVHHESLALYEPRDYSEGDGWDAPGGCKMSC